MDFYCSGCDMIIREDDVTVEEEPSEAWGHTVYEKWYLCPRCGEPVGENYEEDKKIYEPLGRSYKSLF